MTPSAEKKLRTRRSGVPHQATDRDGPDRARFVQRHSRFGLDVRRVVRSQRQVSRWLGVASASIRRRDTNRFSWLGAKAGSVTKRPEKADKTWACEEISTFSSSSAFQRSPQLSDLLARLPRAIMATVSHQRHGQRSRGVGSEVGCVLAEGRSRYADSASLFDHRSQRVDHRSEILLVQPRAWRRKSGHRQLDHAALAAASGLRSLLDRKLLSRREGRTGIGPLRSSGFLASSCRVLSPAL